MSETGTSIETIKANMRRKITQEFETMIRIAELRALSKVSLERPLTDKEYDRMKELYGGLQNV